MSKEIEIKFLCCDLSIINDKIPIRYERYFLNDDVNNQIRIQRKDSIYEKEIKIKINEFEFEKQKISISKSKFIEMSKKSNKSILRDSYLISKSPNITIKKYFGIYEGLIRVEIEFKNLSERENFNIPYYCGIEITGSKIAIDAELIKLNREDFLKELNEIIL